MNAGAEGLGEVRAGIAQAAGDAGRDPAGIVLVAVSKTMAAEVIRPVLAAGHHVFGENYVQESMAKWPALRDEFTDVELHLVVPLQSNKAKDAIALFDVIQSLDRASLATALARAAARTGRQPRLFCQVNTGEEPQKGGLPPSQVDAFLAECRTSYQLAVEGLMCIPPADDPPSPHFALLKTIADRNGVAHLSMGMSADYPRAIQLGATHVRVGTAIFGRRLAAGPPGL